MGVLGYEQIAKSCYEMADAMLRERERTNHDAVPEAIAKPSSTGHAATLDTAVVAGLQRESVGTGNTPILTAEEREAVENMIHLIECQHEDYGKEAATLRKLLERTNLDAVPEAIASPSESSVPLGNGGGCGGTDKPVTLPAMGTGNTTLDGAPAAEAGAGKPQISHPQAGNTQTAPPCVETDGSSPAIAQPPASSQPNRDGMAGSGEELPLDVPQDDNSRAAGGRGLHIPDSRTRLSEAEIDALEYVVFEGRIASMDDYGILRSLLVRVRPEWESESYEESDENRMNTNTNRDATPSEGSVQERCTLTDAERAAISMAYSRLTADSNYGEVAATLKALLERTNHDAVPAAKAEELESSVPLGSGSALANTSEPVAWVAFATDGSESSAVYSMREQAQAAADDWGWSFAPLYARLPLTDKEREALEWFEEVRKPLNSFDDGEYVATLRSLLERLK
jgi:hypothetical protein